MSDSEPLAATLFSEVFMMDQLARSRLSKVLPKGMELSQFSVLNHLAHVADERTPAQLAATFHVTRGAMTNTLSKLEWAGHVHIRPDWDDARRDVLLQRFDLPGNRKLKHLSRGMLMKAALASSLAYRPRLIVMDEPFSGLDALVRDELIEGLLENADGATVVLSSHDLAEIESFASDIGYLDGGRLLFSEEMASLRGRFREVLVCLDAPRPLPPEWPRDWLRPEAARSS